MSAVNILEKSAGHLKDRAATYDDPDGERSIGADLCDDRSTQIEIYDEGGGEFIRVAQPHGAPDIRIDANEWPVIRDAIDRLFEECNK